MADFLDEKRKEIQARLKELQPLVEEYRLLEAADAALSGIGNSASLASTATAAPAAPARRSRSASSRSTRSTGGSRRGRPRGSGTRSAQALDLVRDRPGITIPEMAEAMGIQQNYLYRVLPSLQKDGLVRKEGRGWHPLEAA
jgi:CRP-like cAMP-binding protein